MNTDRFKFRVWDTLSENYIDESWVWLDCDGYTHEGDCELSTIDFIVEQCTGIKDKNGKLIFEGDLVRCITGVVGKVVYFHAGFKVVFDDPMSYPCDIWGDQEIIGNIHEMEIEK